MRVLWILLIAALSCVVGCSSKEKAEKEEAEEQLAREVEPEYKALAERFGQAFINKDYPGAYEMMSDVFQQQVSYGDFEDAMRPYRNAFEGEIKADYQPSDDPQDMPEFVAEEDRKYLVENFMIEFSGPVEGDEDGGFFCTVWIVDNGTPKIVKFYLED